MCAYSEYNGCRVDWKSVLEVVPGRTRQQCVSYINNHKSDLNEYLSQPKVDTEHYSNS